MDPKKMLSKEIAAKVGGKITEETVFEIVDQFFRHGNAFLLLELMNIRKEVENLKQEFHQRKTQRRSFRPLLVP
jgi:hypothetical protein